MVEGHLRYFDPDTSLVKTGFGVGSAKMGGDLDSSLKAANTEALKNAAKNGFGVGLELWDAEHRDKLALQRRAAGSAQARKKLVFDLAKEKLGKDKPSQAEIAKLFNVKPGDLSDDATSRKILEAEGVL